jgi:anti-anti-sigma factor
MSEVHDSEWLEDLAQSGELVIRGGHDADCFVLSLFGELDLATSPMLERRLQMAESIDSAKVVIDLSGLEFIDSTGLHTLVRAQQRWSETGRQFSLLRGPRAVQRVFELTNALQYFTFED